MTAAGPRYVVDWWLADSRVVRLVFATVRLLVVRLVFATAVAVARNRRRSTQMQVVELAQSRQQLWQLARTERHFARLPVPSPVDP